MLLIPRVAGPGEYVARPEFEPSAELLIQPRSSKGEKGIVMDATTYGFQLEERVDELLQPSFQDLAGVGWQMRLNSTLYSAIRSHSASEMTSPLDRRGGSVSRRM